MKIIWPWQWKKIAGETLAQLQETRTHLDAAKTVIIGLQNDLDVAHRRVAGLNKQVQSLSERR